MSSTPLFTKDTYCFTCNAQVVEQNIDTKGHYIILDQTIFYPQGGGQPADHGQINIAGQQLDIIDVRIAEGQIRHYHHPSSATDLNGQLAECKLDQARRLLNSRYHTGGHLLENVINLIYPDLKTIKAHHFPDQSYVEFEGTSPIDISQLQEMVNKAIADNLSMKIFQTTQTEFEQHFFALPYKVPADKPLRVTHIEGFNPLPCGGTHVASMAELKAVIIDKAKVKSGNTKISYSLKD